MVNYEIGDSTLEASISCVIMPGPNVLEGMKLEKMDEESD